jgi:uncharacterized membrane protein YeaQ/YmgE (transglycosylase-associated protein family)
MLTLLVVLLVIVVLVALGVVGLAFQIVWWILVGLVIGALGRLVLPGPRPIGWLRTIAAGVTGSIVGGLLGDAFGGNALLDLVLAVAVSALMIAALWGTQRGHTVSPRD